MRHVKISIENMARQEYAAQQMMKEIVQAQMEQAEQAELDGYDVEWSFTGELILTEKGSNNG